MKRTVYELPEGPITLETIPKEHLFRLRYKNFEYEIEYQIPSSRGQVVTFDHPFIEPFLKPFLNP